VEEEERSGGAEGCKVPRCKTKKISAEGGTGRSTKGKKLIEDEDGPKKKKGWGRR